MSTIDLHMATLDPCMTTQDPHRASLDPCIATLEPSMITHNIQQKSANNNLVSVKILIFFLHDLRSRDTLLFYLTFCLLLKVRYILVTSK